MSNYFLIYISSPSVFFIGSELQIVCARQVIPPA